MKDALTKTLALLLAAEATLAKASRNPIASLSSMPFENKFN